MEKRKAYSNVMFNTKEYAVLQACMDFYRMKNVLADTSMRESIAGNDKTGPPAS